VLDQALGLFDHHFGDLDVALRGFVEGRGHHFALHAERCMSVTSSGRSSISRTSRNTSGWLSVIALAMFCSITVLPTRGGATISVRWPLPCGETMSMTRADLSFCGRIGGIERQLRFRIQRRQVVEIDAVAHRFGIVEIHRIELEQREIALAILGRADLAFDGIARAQAEACGPGSGDT
jgi:hypothetical protein